jgi:hypothetical protein
LLDLPVVLLFELALREELTAFFFAGVLADVAARKKQGDTPNPTASNGSSIRHVARPLEIILNSRSVRIRLS